jgi:hypothetical protein
MHEIWQSFRDILRIIINSVLLQACILPLNTPLVPAVSSQGGNDTQFPHHWCRLYNEGLNSLRCVTSNDRIINE